MSKPTAQAARSIDAMKAAGFQRSEFSVKTERNRIPARHGGGVEYGSARITIYATAATAAPRVPAMLANGLNVSIYKGAHDDGREFYIVDADDAANGTWANGRPTPTLTVRDSTAPDPRFAEYGLPSTYTDGRAWAIYGDLMRSVLTAKTERLDREQAVRSEAARARSEAIRQARAERNSA